jgi:light-regulated signal transduction histidine kinase (bacteriophytochrome)
MIAQDRTVKAETALLLERNEVEETDLLQQLARAQQDLDEFVYIVSHDLVAPLRAIDSLAGWIATDFADNIDEDGQEMLALLGLRTRRLHQMLDGLLQFSRIGRIVEQKTNLDLKQFVPDIIEKLDHGEAVDILIQTDLPVIWAEPTRIEQIFENLLSNAIRAIDKPAGKIEISCREASEYWEFRVTDNGVGIEEKQFARIFQIFQTLQPRDETEENGVGLALVKKIVETNGGRIWVESQPGQGSSFNFTYPKYIPAS